MAASAVWVCSVLVLVLWTVVAVEAYGRREPLACEIRCCDFTPACRGATLMICHCSNVDQLRLRAGDIPITVQYIEIFSAQSVIFGPRALYELHGLRELAVRDVHSLEVLTDGLALPDTASLQTLRVDRLDNVQLQKDAVSGRWPGSAELRFYHIGHMHMQQRALHFEADGEGPQLLLEHVADLHAKSGAFKATMHRVLLVNVSMRSCQPGTFRGTVGKLTFLGCNLKSIESRCMQPDKPWKEVLINACDITDVREGALTGDVGSLLLTASNITRLHRSAVEMSLQRLELSRMHVRDMETHALNVSVCSSLALMSLSVDELRRHALAGVRLVDCPRQDVRPFTIHLLRVARAESGSLAVHESVPASAVNWDSIMFSTKCSCEMRDDVDTLVAGDEVATMTDTQRALVDIIWDRGFCSGATGDQRLIDAAADCPGWDGAGGKGASGGGGETSLDQNIVFYAVIAGVALLVLVLVSVLVAKRRRVGRVLGCAGRDAAGGDTSVCDTLQSRRTAGTTANSTLSTVMATSTMEGKHRYDEKGLPDLLTAAPGVDLSPPHPGSYHASHAAQRAEAPHEHIYAEIGPVPAVSDYADPRDSLALQQEGETAPERGQYAEIAPLVGSPEPAEVAPPPPSSLPPVENVLYAKTDDLECPVTHL